MPAQELHLTGCAIVADAFSLVVAEGGPKSQKRYQKLMLQRIDWGAAEEGDEPPEDDAPPDQAPGAAAFPSHMSCCTISAVAWVTVTDAASPLLVLLVCFMVNSGLLCAGSPLLQGSC